jgi:hypothetical protein
VVHCDGRHLRSAALAGETEVIDWFGYAMAGEFLFCLAVNIYVWVKVR